jgi:hypothetical protein
MTVVHINLSLSPDMAKNHPLPHAPALTSPAAPRPREPGPFFP